MTRKARRSYTSKKEKQPNRVPVDKKLDNNLTWGISLMSLEGPFNWSDIKRDKYLEILKKLSGFEARTLNCILGGNSHGISIDKISKIARKELINRKLDDNDRLISLRVSGKERIWGIRYGKNHFKVLWWDPEHEVCPSSKRHT